MKKWALQMRTMGKYLKHSAMIDSKYNKTWSRSIFIIMSLLFFGAFFIWFNDTATFLSNESMTTASTMFTDKLFNGGTFEMSDFEVFFNALRPLVPNLVRIMFVPILTVLFSLLFTIPYLQINVYENSDKGEKYVGKELFSLIVKSFGKMLLPVLALIVPVVFLSLFGGTKWFLNYGLLPTLIFTLLYLIMYFTMCFRVDPDENDEGAHYPYDAISKQVKTIIHSRIKSNESVPVNEQMKDIGAIVHNIEKSYENEESSAKVNKSPFKKAVLLFKITWSRSAILMLILQYIVPILQVTLISVLKYTQRDLIIYAGLGFLTAFAVMFEIRFVTRLYYDLVHGVRMEEVDNVNVNEESEE